MHDQDKVACDTEADCAVPSDDRIACVSEGNCAIPSEGWLALAVIPHDVCDDEFCI